MDIINVIELEPKLKHPTIFDKFDKTSEGEAFIINNDHDPKPLYYQMLAERGPVFSWEYLENGPEIWQVKISKLTPEQEKTIGELVASDFRKADVFKKFGLDFCCGGGKTVSKACSEKEIDINEVQKALKEVEKNEITQAGEEQQANEWSAVMLVNFIVNKYHKYVRDSLPLLYEYTQKVARVHGNNHPETIEIANTIVDLSGELERHMNKEENEVFPLISEINDMYYKKDHNEIIDIDEYREKIGELEDEHQEAGVLLEKINKLTNNFSPPEGACTTFRISYQKMEEFEKYMHQHIHLENNILFKKCEKLLKALDF